jgi:hypothetical protein
MAVGMVASAALVTASPAATASKARAAQAPAARWRVATTFTKNFPIVTAAAPVAGNDVWVMGTGSARPGGRSFPIGRHWNGRSWVNVRFPSAASSSGISCAGDSSAANIWAFAGSAEWANGPGEAGALRLEHGKWVQVHKFPAADYITNCLVVGPSEVWVFGDSHVGPGIGTWHLHGRSWTQTSTGLYALEGASAIRPDDVWGLGEDGFLRPVVARWNGRSWVRNRQLAAALGKTPPGGVGITALSDHSVWLGLVKGGASSRSLEVLKWNGRHWRKVGPSSPGFYLPFAVHGKGGWWADTAEWLPHGSVLHRVHDRWVKVPVRTAGCAQPPIEIFPVGGSATILGLQFCGQGSVRENVLAYGRLP